jgi:hypothetical protein
MTTIAYRDGVLATDSRAGSWTMEGHAVKGHRFGRCLVAAAGSAAHAQAFYEWVRTGMVGDAPMGNPDKDDYNATGFIFMPCGRIVKFQPGCPPLTLTAPFYAYGSGGYVALGAMEAGATAEQAVMAAAKWDAGTGGPIRTLRHLPFDYRKRAA